MKKDKLVRLFPISILTALVLTAVIWLIKDNLAAVAHLPDTGYDWYFWKLPVKEFIPRFTAWGSYILHQVLAWFLIFKLTKTKGNARFKYNIAFLMVNLFFSVWHIAQTHIWYDGLAQDVPVWSSQGSVIVMLVLVLIMENSRRGLFFGKKVPLPAEAVKSVRKTHGYIISWAVIYTFWYHPMEGTAAHLVGFFYVFLLMIQMAFAYTKIHNHFIWTFILEILVLIHGTTVAIMQGNGMWPMFLTGFAVIFITTQLYGLRLKKIFILLITALFLMLLFFIYSGIIADRTFGDIHEIIRIPLIEYLLVFLFVGLIAIGLKVKGIFYRKGQ